ncbi:MAG: hypothetical protein H3C31_01490 [Brumimicrobium sp.]|nr:hypothetical protein [Brumimicrobium sp.]
MEMPSFNLDSTTIQWIVIAVVAVIGFLVYRKFKGKSDTNTNHFDSSFDGRSTSNPNQGATQGQGDPYQQYFNQAQKGGGMPNMGNMIIKRAILLIIPIFLIMGISMYFSFSKSGLDFKSFFTDNGDSMVQGKELQSGFFSKDGKYFIYTTQTIGMRGISGYIQAIDLSTSQKTLKKDYKSNEMFTVIQADEEGAWIRCFNSGDNRWTPALFDYKNGKMIFSPEDIIKLNPSISLTNTLSFQKNTTTKSGVITESEDGYYYLINSKTGKAEKIDGNFENLYLGDSDLHLLIGNTRDYSYSGQGQRNNITINDKRTGNPLITSADSFIDPKVLTSDITEDEDDYNFKPLEYKSNIFVLSNNATDNKGRIKSVSMLDAKTLDTKWTVLLDQIQNRMDAWYDKERFHLEGNILYFTNTSYLYKINMDNGEVEAQISLTE